MTESRTITKPVSGTISIYFNGVLQSSALYSANLTNGQITFISAPGVGVNITADFEFDVPVRFDIDRLSASMDDYAVGSWNDIPLVETRI